MTKEITTHTQCKNCLTKMPPRQDGWCSQECYDNLLRVWNNTWNSNVTNKKIKNENK